MATTLKCRVCGKQYEGCRSLSGKTTGTFRWQSVACSPECGQIYLAGILASRQPAADEQVIQEQEPPSPADSNAEWQNETEHLAEDFSISEEETPATKSEG